MAAVPTRKLYHVAKLSLLVILVVTILTLFEHWHGGKRSAGATFSDPIETEYERQIIEDEARIVPGIGEGGAAAHLVGEEKKLGEESEKKLAINVYLSDRIPYNRTLKDFRNPTCTRVIYDAELPSASVILIFHNEPYSVVLRTLWSVINSARRSNEWFQFANFYDRQTGKTMNLGYSNQDPESPFVYIKEIILVDDSSTLPELKGKLSHYIRTRLPPDLIKILRLPERVGLIRARMAGAQHATSDVLVYLDTHCEVQRDWLRPLLQAIKDKPQATVVPIIDVIDSSTFYYSVLDPSNFQVGGFSFLGHFTWIDVPEREKKRRGSDIAPTWSPTMAGGLFAISRKYFFELGGYDEQMAGWGGENLEMSFRIWQCGGTLETIPCSRVGHVFRAFHPYGMPAESDTHGINTARMAEVWMDEYAELFYIHRPDLRNNPKIGDVTHRKILREKLRCKNFQWYLDNIYKEKFIPVRDAFGFGRFRNIATGMCLDSLQKDRDGAPLGYYPCHPEIQATQFYTFTNLGELRDEQNCASVKVSRTPSRSTSIERASVASRPVLMTSCHGLGREQKWRRLPTGQLEHVDSKLCLQSTKNSEEARVEVCRTTGYESQVWLIDYSEENGFHSETDLGGGIEREARINMLRGSQKRISRSLQSYPEQPLSNHVEPKDEGIKEETDNPKKHRNKQGKQHKRHGHKKAKSRSHTKNKFILKLLRTLTNGTEDHLEVDIHCKHHQLYPNNSFVRDLVTILNDQNIKVVNNGRVFERNRVTDTRTETPANQDANVTPAEPKHSKPRTHRVKKRKHIPIVAPQALNPATPKPAEYAEEERSPRPEAQDKRIIIEDFFKLEPPSTPAPTDASIVSERLPMFVHKPRKQHRRPKQPPSTPHPRADEQKLLQENWEKRKSDVVEETDSPVEDDNIIPDPSVWRMDPSQFRRKGDSQHSNDESLERAVHRARPRENIETTVAPVKVVLRSNLSFTLGDDVLRWRARATDDLVNEFLGELAIPTNNSHIHPQATTEVYERIRSSESSSESESDEVKSI